MRDREQFSEAVAGRVKDRFEMMGTVAYLHHAHSDAAKRKQFALRFFENRRRQNGRAGTKIEDSLIQFELPSGLNLGEIQR